ncbi:MAG: hypothetical protein AAGE52_11770 [Myxococcota bacterium]
MFLLGGTSAFWALYGVWAWVVVAIVATLAPVFAIRLRRRALRELRREADAAEGHSGRLIADAPASSFRDESDVALSQEGPGENATIRSARGLRLSTKTETIRLDGPYRIEVGHRDLQGGQTIRDVLLEEEVRVIGPLLPPRDPAAYRDELILQGSAIEPLRIVAAHTELQMRPRVWVRCIASAALFLLTTPVAGAFATHFDIPGLAAAIPTSRGDALSSTAEALRQSLGAGHYELAPGYLHVMTALDRRCAARPTLRRAEQEELVALLEDCPEDAPPVALRPPGERQARIEVPPASHFEYLQLVNGDVVALLTAGRGANTGNATQAACVRSNACTIALAVANPGRRFERLEYLDFESANVWAMVRNRAHAPGTELRQDAVPDRDLYHVAFIAPGLRRMLLDKGALHEQFALASAAFDWLMKQGPAPESGPFAELRWRSEFARNGLTKPAQGTVDDRRDVLHYDARRDREFHRTRRSLIEAVAFSAGAQTTLESALSLGRPRLEQVLRLPQDAAHVVAAWRPELATEACEELQNPVVFHQPKPSQMLHRIVTLAQLREVFCGIDDSAILERVHRAVLDPEHARGLAILELRR